MLDATDYKNGQKNNWRRRAWNHIASLADKDAVVLYLPGERDLDRKEAVQRGFKDNNLIAVERDKSVAATLRKQGVNTINSDLLTVLQNWPNHTPIGVVIADLQCGFDPAVFDLVKAFALHPALYETTFLVNLQRGRDTLFVRLPEQIEKEAALEKTLLRMLSAFQPAIKILPVWALALHAFLSDKRSNTTLNRAWRFAQLYHTCSGEMARLLNDAHAIRNAIYQLIDGATAAKGSDRVAQLRWLNNMSQLRAQLHACLNRCIIIPLPSYRSAPAAPLMDSVIVRCDAPPTTFYSPPLDAPTRAKISAALAIRTARMRKQRSAA